jgi:hypothetical protein
MMHCQVLAIITDVLKDFAAYTFKVAQGLLGP